jgi:NhaP-type Na+/H+ or K+/H+ antiporter
MFLNAGLGLVAILLWTAFDSGMGGGNGSSEQSPAAVATEPIGETILISPEEEAEREASSFLAIFVCLVVLVIGTLITYALRRTESRLPSSWAYVALGSLLSTVIYSGASEQLRLIRETLHDSFSVIFFAALLPIIIFESGYSMHKVRKALICLFFCFLATVCVYRKAFSGTLEQFAYLHFWGLWYRPLLSVFACGLRE